MEPDSRASRRARRRRCNRRLLADGASVATLDCPVLGTKAPAEKGALTALVSGDAELVDRVRPALASMTVKTVVAGSVPGEGSALKLACNAMVASLTAATAQSITMATALGVDPTLVLTALDGGPIGAPYTQIKGTAMIDGDFTPSFGVDGVIKDLDLMIDAVPERTARMLTAVRSAFADAADAGHGSDDLSAVVTAFRP